MRCASWSPSQVFLFRFATAISCVLPVKSCHLYHLPCYHLCQNPAPVPLQLPGPRRGQCYHVCPQRLCLLHLLSSLVDPALLLAVFETCIQVFSATYFTPPVGLLQAHPPVGESAESPDYRLFMGAGGRTDGLRAQWKLLLSTHWSCQILFEA